MGDAGNGFALLNAGGAHKRAGGNKKNIFKLAAFNARQNVAACHSGAAAAAGSSGFHLLAAAVINQKAAVIIIFAEYKALFFHKVAQKRRANKAEVAGKNKVIILRRRICVAKELRKSGAGGGRHGGAHVVLIVYAKVLYGAEGNGLYERGVSFFCNDGGACCGCRPLSGGRALAAVFKRKAVLTLRAAKMRGSNATLLAS